MKRATGLGWPLAAGGIVMLAALLAPDVTAGPFRNPWRTTTSVERLAKQLDHLERELQYSGRITAKAPDVWGQARLTQHRQEFEKQFVAQLDAFKPTLNANIAVADQAFLLEALTLSAASNSSGQEPAEINKDTFNAVIGITSAGANPEESGAPSKGFVFSSPSDGFLKPANPASYSSTNLTEFGLEPEILLDQRKRFLNHLHEIRRINEGDDTTDAPGYSLNLVRIPVSLIPGDRTRVGYGAEITVTAEPHVTPELLPQVYRQLVINDLVDQLALSLVKMTEGAWRQLQGLEYPRSNIGPTNTDPPIPLPPSPALPRDAAPAPPISETTTVPSSKISQIGFYRTAAVPFAKEIERRIIEGVTTPRQPIDAGQTQMAPANAPNEWLPSLLDDADRTRIFGTFFASSVPGGDSRRARLAMSRSQLPVVLGTQELAVLAYFAFSQRDKLNCRDQLDLGAVKSLLRQELETAYDFVWSLPYVHSTNLTPEIILNAEMIREQRESFYCALPGHQNEEDHGHVADTPTEALAWAILVESALLNRQLNEDFRRVQQDPNCACSCDPSIEYQFFGTQPPDDARHAFVEYVKCRWPVRVFALDPEAQMQNVGDTYSMRREMQLAVALAFQQRRVNVQNLLRYVRKLEMNMQTIALNQTAVAFGQGEDTFGWRFFPRVQTPDIESNLTVAARDLIVGGPNRDALLKQRRIEPGPRECTALVVMPSFVKHVRFDVRSNWFSLVPCKLTGHGHLEASNSETVEWSREVKAVEDAMAMCIQDEHLYRFGEVERLVKRAKQISTQLPLQTMYAHVPFELTLGGFEMFSSGVTDLAPELVGFYGAPGFKEGADTTVFVVGKHLSVTNTKVIAGNQTVDPTLISREVMQITIPAGARVEKRLCEPRAQHQPCPCDGDCNDRYVEIRVATPYGVSSPLLVPVVAGEAESSAPQLSWAQDTYRVRYVWKKAASATTAFTISDVRVAQPLELKIAVPDSILVPTSAATLQLAIAGEEYSVQLNQNNLLVAAVPFNSADRCYRIDGAKFITVQSAVKEAVLAKLSAGNAQTPPSDSYVVRMTATVILPDGGTTPIPVAGELLIPITFTPAQ